MERTPGKKLVKFEFKGEPKQVVYVAGSFNDWNPDKSRLKEEGEGVYAASLRLAPGRHEYKFVVNGNWYIDPNRQDWVPNAHGSLNSVITVA